MRRKSRTGEVAPCSDDLSGTKTQSLRVLPLDLVLVGAVIALATVAYVPVLDTWFHGDDFRFLVGAQRHDFLEYSSQAVILGKSPVPDFEFYRPVYLVLLKVLFSAYGLHAWAYHATNLAAHLLNVVLLWLLALQLTHRRQVAHLAAAAFALHPAWTGAVQWMSAGNSVFATTLALCSALAFLLFLKERTRLTYLLSLIAFGGAVFTHFEAAPVIVVPLVALLLERLGSDRPSLFRQARLAAPFLVVATLALITQLWTRAHSDVIREQYYLGGETLTKYLRGLSLMLYPEDVEGASFTLVHELSAFLFILGAALVVARARAARGVALLVALWLVVAMLPLSISPLFSGKGRKLYAAGPPLSLMLALAAGEVLRLLARVPRHGRVVAAAVGLALTVAAFVGVRDSIRFWRKGGDLNLIMLNATRRSHPVPPAGGHIYLIGFDTPPLPDYLPFMFQSHYVDLPVSVVESEERLQALLAADDGVPLVIRP